MKRFLLLLLTLILVISTSLFVACGSGTGTDSGQNSASGGVSDSSGVNSGGSSGGGSSSTPDTPVGPEIPDDDELTIAQVKALIDKQPNGVSVEFSGVVVGFDSMGYAHVGDETGIIYVRAKHANLTKGAFVKVTGTGYVYTGSSSYPEYTRQIKADGIVVESLSGTKPDVKPALALLAQDLNSYNESNMLTAAFQGNLVTLTGTVSVGKDKYTYYLLDDAGNVMVGLHHYSQFFNNSVDDAQNSFNALNGKKITIEGIIYRYYTKEGIWTFQYVGDTLYYEIIDGGEVVPTVCPVCGSVIVNNDDHAALECGHNACESGDHGVCSDCGEYLCNGSNHSHAVRDWCILCGQTILAGDTSHTTKMPCGHSKCLQNIGDHNACAVCGGYACDGESHEHNNQVLAVQKVKELIDKNPDGVNVTFKGFVIGEDARGYFHVSDQSGAIYVRARAAEYDVSVGDYVQISGRGYVYKGSATYPEYTRQIDYNRISITKLESGATAAMEPMVLAAEDLKTTSESADISNPIHGNLVQITGYLSVGDDIYSYYLLDEEGNKLVGLHHVSQHFNESTDDYRNAFNTFNGQEVTLTGVIYRYYTKENIWTFQYISLVNPAEIDESVINGVRYELSPDRSYAIVKEKIYREFNNYIYIESTFMGAPVTEIDEYAFSSKFELLYVYIPASVQTIGKYAFCNCIHLAEVRFGEGSQLNAIDSEAFRDCKNLNKITFKQNLTTIGYSAFERAGLTEITLPASLKTVASNAFKDCTNLDKVYFEGNIDDWAKINFENKEASPMHVATALYLNGVLLGDTINITYATEIGTYAFCNLTNVTEVILGQTVNSIGYSAFSGCNSIAKITMPCIDIEFYNNGTNSRLSKMFGGEKDVPTTLKTVVLSSGTTVYDAYFRGLRNITTIVLPESITKIEDCAFEDCTALTSINLPDSITLIAYASFKGCESLTEVDLPVNLETINSWAFAFTGITTIKIPFKTTSIGSNAFNGCESLKTICIHANLESLGEEVFSSTVTTVYFTGAETWEEFTQKVGGFSRYIPGTKVHVSSYTLD